MRHADLAGFWVARLLFGMHGRTTVVSLTPWQCPWHCLTAPGHCFLSPKTFSVHPRASLSRPGTLSLRPRNQDIAVLLNAFGFRRSPGYGSGTTSLGSSSSGHSHASRFSAPSGGRKPWRRVRGWESGNPKCGSGWFCVVLSGSGWFWVVLGGSGWF